MNWPDHKVYIGRKFNSLTILDVFKSDIILAKCLCDCGKISNKIIHRVLSGGTKTCGCAHALAITKHGFCGTKEYATWQHMLRRCDNFDDPKAHLYAKKGIRVCDRWLKFDYFLEDMGLAPSPQHSLDRKDGDLGYYKDNCRWATKLEQARNTRANRMLEYNGESKCLHEWASIYNIHPNTLIKRLKLGWSIEMALTNPVDSTYRTIGNTKTK